ncbi:MAG: ABC transporter permease [Actinobacteria bacterium]|nr:ABC transporter permease [Actinomycetota bacterium]MBU1943163.1 ABC transporter permease [Actinomycetota bacterium]MBU2687891.1 ABC transporter permease [Actinomycetota bacterium]
MNLNLFKKTVSDRWRSTAVFGGGILAYVLMTTALYPTFRDISGIEELLDKYPKDFLRLFGVESFDITSFGNFVTAELLGLMWVIIVVAFVLGFARSVIAGEIHDGTMELLLSQPISRWSVVTSQALAIAAGIVTLVVVTVLGIVGFGAALGIEIFYRGFFAFIPVGICLLLAIAGYSLLFSTLLKDPRRVVMASAGLTLAFYMLHFAGAYWRVADRMDVFGIFHYYNPASVIDSGTVPVGSLLALLAFAAVGFTASLVVFRRRDVAP